MGEWTLYLGLGACWCAQRIAQVHTRLKHIVNMQNIPEICVFQKCKGLFYLNEYYNCDRLIVVSDPELHLYPTVSDCIQKIIIMHYSV